MAKHKMTGCARMFIAILIIAPLAYLAAAYYNGEDGIQNIKDLLGIDGKKQDNPSDDTYMDTGKDLEKKLSELEDQIKKLQSENDALRKENADLKEQIDQQPADGDGQ